MKSKTFKILFSLIILGCIFFVTCENGIMGKWWDEEGHSNVKVTFVSNCEIEIHPQHLRSGSLIAEPKPEREGCTLVGWYLDKELLFRFDFRHPISNENLTLYAKWLDSITLYTVTFVVNGGTPSSVPSAQVIAGALIPPPPSVSKTISGNAYGFGGWQTFEGQQWNFAYDRMPAEDITLYAAWHEDYHTVTFNTGDGGPPVPEQKLATGAFIIEPKPTRSGYTFEGWYLENENGAAPPPFKYRFNFSHPISDEDLTLYANWIEVKTYDVTFKPVGGTFSGGSTVERTIPVTEGNTVERPAITYSGKGFAGWYTDENYTSSSLWDFNTPVTRNMTLYARWEEEHFTVQFNLKLPDNLPSGATNSSTPSNQNIYLNNRITEPAADPWITVPSDAAGWSFMGWYYSANANFDPNNKSHRDALIPWDFNRSLTEDLPMKEDYPNPPVFTLYARWVENVDYMVWVRKGNFTMGKGTTGTITREHNVEITEGFFISEHEVTQQIYKEVLEWAITKGLVAASQVNLTPSNFTGSVNYPNPHQGYPVERVSWYDAVFFCNLYTQYINEKETRPLNQVYNISNIVRAPDSGFQQTTRPRAIIDASVSIRSDSKNIYPSGYRLPTEAEWEYAARGGYRSTTAGYLYSGSNTVGDVAWYNTTTSGTGTRDVGTKTKNSLGIFDMSGNVYEWCWDWYSSTYYTLQPTPHINPIGPSSGTERVRRGGCWNNIASNVEVTAREKADSANANWVIGFRLVRGAEVVY